jgi:hypothetical protein
LRAAFVPLSGLLVVESLGALFMLPDELLGGDVLGLLVASEPCEGVLGAVVDPLGDVDMLGDVLGAVVLGCCALGLLCEFGDVLESLVCAYTMPATTAKAAVMPTTMDLDLFMKRLLSR